MNFTDRQSVIAEEVGRVNIKTTTTTTTTTLPEIGNIINNTEAVRDFAYTSGISSESASEANITTPLSTIAESSNIANTSSISTEQSDNPNKLSYTRFYNPSWTLSPDEESAITLPALDVVQRPPFQSTQGVTAIKIKPPANKSRPSRHLSNNSADSQYSTYSTYPAPTPKYPAGVGLQTVESGVEVDIRSSTAPLGRAHSGTEPHSRHDSAKTTSSTYSTYST